MHPLTFVYEPGRPMAEITLIEWLANAAPGDQIVYWRGRLSNDINVVHQGLTEIERKRLCRVARRAWHMSELDQVHLVQRRVDIGVFDYIAIARPKPRRSPSRWIKEAA